ncbi:hypothetical protein ACF8O9_03290 [Stenotrophomonas geniculata]|uniref:hypothetical protein n=1 Tax=Stenotrophomonas TaxID=40323 RepID=UPI001F3348DE|nr:hypothetical protein [Stenotrophomonas sp. 9(2022)]MCF3501746.1 hypothetical protein [Stenotrophomonas maltophilia]MCI1118894.1 hypothetical protein [Stenotrophomonas maltophilia]
MRASSIVGNARSYPAAWLGALLVLVYLFCAAGAGGTLLTVLLLACAGIFVAVASSQLLCRQNVLAVIFVLALCIVALATPSPAWDARSIWLFHGKRIFYEASLYAQLDDYAVWSHNDYPSLVPALMASVAHVIGHWNDVFPKVVVPLAMLPPLLVILPRIPRLEWRMVFLLVLVALGGNHLVDGYVDALLSLAFVAVFLLVNEITATDEPDFGQYVQLTVMAALLALVKNEGGALLLCAALAGLAGLLLRGHRMKLAMVVSLAVAILPLLAWKLSVAHAGLSNDLAGSDLMGQLTGRLGDIRSYWLLIDSLLFSLPTLLLLPPLLLIAFVARRNSISFYVLPACASYVAVLVVVYMSTPNDLPWHLATSADRTMLPVWLLATCSLLVDLAATRERV